MEHYRKRRDKETGDYVDTSAIRWCRTCRFFRRSRQYEDAYKGAWTFPTMPEDEILPCRNLGQTREMWVAYYVLPRGKRTLFPKTCDRWTAK